MFHDGEVCKGFAHSYVSYYDHDIELALEDKMKTRRDEENILRHDWF